jgi:hypothetical protein
MLVDRQSRMFFIVWRVHMLSAIFLAIFALGFWTWLDISNHTAPKEKGDEKLL